ncbi:oligosaccharide flippase family protein [Modestobacter sp. VKM Ac-2986]|uniref:lipopolysaccharide biosynthesis protein n=1 Tax=Modestobacter sp. VKM Ac-2986 TaxID=3004140 RepID=UPI0022AB88A3|nr:oligosaccharide flippase family protein [Modestobacter sp. VKM Ac-2986]MCZ2829870.1 oligosaccharide flippase family protein [Modestobacter sp. VKM Ac-2986]
MVSAPAEDPAQVPSGQDAAEGDGPSSLFGRDLLYVGVLGVQLLSAVVVSPVLAYLLPPEQFGQLSSAIALHQVLVILAVMGLDQSLILLRAEAGGDAPARALVGVGLLGAVLLTVIAFLTQPLWGPALGFDQGARILVVTVAWTPFAAGVLLVSAMLLSQDRLRAFAFINIFAGIGGQVLGLAILVLGGERDAGHYAEGNLVALAVTVVIGLLLVRPGWRGVAALEVSRRGLQLGIPLMISGLAIYVLNAGDRLVILKLMGPADAGRYQIAYTIGNVAVLLLSMTDGAWLPRIAAVRDQVERSQVVAGARNGLLKLMLPVLLGITLGAPLGLRIVAPPDYRPGDLLPVVFVVALAAFPVLIGIASHWVLVTLGRTRNLAVSAIAAAVVNVGLNVVLVPVWGLVGAAAATAAAFAVQALGHQLALPAGVRIPRTPPRLALAVLAVVGLSAATLWLPDSPASLGVRFGLAVLCLPWLLVQLRAARNGDSGGGVAGRDARPSGRHRRGRRAATD